jgi:hypothetical protein
MTLPLLLGLSCYGLAQTPLAKAFADMHSSDPNVANKARLSMPAVAEQAFPTIEKDSTTLCNALSDPDPEVRQQSAGILQAIVLVVPEHNSVVVSCFPQLIITATDATDFVRNDSLFALAMNPAGPPPQAHDVFVKSLGSDKFRTAELGAAGLLKEKGANAEANQILVQKALEEAPDAKHRLNILYAISGTGVPSDILFAASQKYMYDPDTNVQHEAINAVAATGTDRSKVITVMQNLAGSSSAGVEQKKHAQAILNSLTAQPQH